MDKVYIAIDLKSFYASVECADRNLNPLTTNLVVADEGRTEKTICLAVTPSLKAHGIPGRARLFEVIQAVKGVNNKRFNTALRLGVLPKDENGRYHFASTSFDAEALEADPSLELSYIVAPPRMKLYEEISTKIFSIYMRYISAEDIHVYSIDECFIDATSYLDTYRMTPHELAIDNDFELIREQCNITSGVTLSSIRNSCIKECSILLNNDAMTAKLFDVGIRRLEAIKKQTEHSTSQLRNIKINKRMIFKSLFSISACTDFRQILPIAALKKLTIRHYGELFRLAPVKIMLENPYTPRY